MSELDDKLNYYNEFRGESKGDLTVVAAMLTPVFFAKHTTKYETLTIHFSHFMQISYFINAAKK